MNEVQPIVHDYKRHLPLKALSSHIDIIMAMAIKVKSQLRVLFWQTERWNCQVRVSISALWGDLTLPYKVLTRAAFNSLHTHRLYDFPLDAFFLFS